MPDRWVRYLVCQDCLVHERLTGGRAYGLSWNSLMLSQLFHREHHGHALVEQDDEPDPQYRLPL